MKIALDATYSVGDHLSGVGVYSREILLGLAAAAPGPWVWCYRTHRLTRAFRGSAPRNVRRRPLFDRWVPAADLFHGLNQRLPQTSLRQSVVTFHDLFVLTGDYSSPEFRARFAAQARDAAARATAIIAVSEFTASQVHQLLDIPSERIFAVPHGVRFRDIPQRPRQPIVLCVGAVQRRKNIARLVRAFAALPRGWRLVLAGSLGYGAEDAMREIEASPRRADIQLTGWIDDRQLLELYASASVFAFPSLDEGFGIPILEAMTAGLPVLTSNVSALPEVAGDAALTVDPRNEDEIASALKTLCADHDLRAALIERGYLRASSFTWEAAVQKTLDVYRRCCGLG